MEIIDLIAKIYERGGVSMLVIVGFFVLVIYVMKQSAKREDTMRKDNKEREDKLYLTIEVLSKDLPEIKDKMNEISNNISKILIK